MRLSEVVAQEKVRQGEVRHEEVRQGEENEVEESAPQMEKASDAVLEREVTEKQENVKVETRDEASHKVAPHASNEQKALNERKAKENVGSEVPIEDTEKAEVLKPKTEPPVNIDPQQEEEADEETICPCSSTANVGFMIACDDCDTWQHGKCMGYRRRSDAPEKYYCHLCRPGAVRKGSKAHAIIASRREECDKYLEGVEGSDLRRKLAHALVQKESRKWKSKDAWVAHVIKAFAGLLRSLFKSERPAVVSGLSKVLNMKEVDVDGKLRYASRRLRKNGSKSHKQGSTTASGGDRAFRNPRTSEASSSRKSKEATKRVGSINASRLRNRDIELRRRLLKRPRNDDFAREDEFDIVTDKPSPVKPIPVKSSTIKPIPVKPSPIKPSPVKEERKSRRSSGDHLSREERKIQQIMKQFERLEKQKNRKKPAQSHSAPRSNRHDTGSPNITNTGRTSNGNKKDKVGKYQDLKSPKQTHERKRSVDSTMQVDIKQDVEHAPLSETRKTPASLLEEPVAEAQEQSRGRVELNMVIDCGEPTRRVENDAGHESEGDFDEEKPLFDLTPKRRRLEAIRGSRPIINYNRKISEDREDERNSEKEYDNGSLSTITVDDSDIEAGNRSFKRPRLSLSIPTPGPSVLGSPLIPESLRSPLADAGEARKRPRVLDRKSRLLKTTSSQDLPTKKKLLMSALSPGKKINEIPISPSSLPSCFVSKESEGLSVGMVLVNVDRESGDESSGQQGRADTDFPKTPSTGGFGPFRPLPGFANNDRKEEFSSSTCSSPDKDQCETPKSAVERTSSCLKKRPRLRLEAAEEYDFRSPVTLEQPRSPTRSPRSPPLKSPRPSMMLGFRSVPAPSPGRKTPQLRSTPLKSSPLLSTPAPLPTSTSSFPRSRFTAADAGVEQTISKSTGRHNLVAKKFRLLSPEVKTSGMHNNLGGLLRGVSPLRMENGQCENGQCENETIENAEEGAKSMESGVIESSRVAKVNAPGANESVQQSSMTKEEPRPRLIFKSVPKVVTNKTVTTLQTPIPATTGPGSSSISRINVNANGDEDSHATETTSPSDIVQTRMRRFLNRSTDKNPMAETPASTRAETGGIKGFHQHTGKLAGTENGVQDLRKTIDNNRNGMHGKRNGPGYNRPFAYNGYNTPTSSWTNGYRSSYRGKPNGNYGGGVQNGGLNRYDKHGRQNYVNGSIRGNRGMHHGGSMNGGRNWRPMRRFGNNVNGSVSNGVGPNHGPGLRPPVGNNRGPGGQSSVGMQGKSGNVGPANWRSFREHNGWVGNVKGGRKISPNGDARGLKSVRP